MSGRQWWDYRAIRAEREREDKQADKQYREETKRVRTEVRASLTALEREVFAWNTTLTVQEAVKSLVLHIRRLEDRVAELEGRP